MPVIPFGEYRPDLPEFQNPGATVATNVMPLTEKSYGPFRSLVSSAAGLVARCQGAFGAKDYTDTGYAFAGDTTSLYYLGKNFVDSFFAHGFFSSGFFTRTLGTDNTWVDISRDSHYSLSEEANWQFVQFGNAVIACTAGMNIQYCELNVWTTDVIGPGWFVGGWFTDGWFGTYVPALVGFHDISDTAPQAKYCAIVRDFLMVGNIIGPDGAIPNQVWWSAINAPTNWPTPGTSEATAVQSDNQMLPEGGAIQGLIGACGGADGAVFLEEAIYRLIYVGSPTIFQIDKVEKTKGTRIPGSIVNIGTVAFYIGIDGFYIFDGTNSVPIGFEKIDRYFFDDFDSNYVHRVVAAVDTNSKVIMWAYPGRGHIQGNPNKILLYNWVLQRWTLIEQELEYFFRSYTTGYTLEDLDKFGTMDTLPYSLDSAAWAGGALQLSVFNTSHYVGSFTGDNLAATVETGEFDGGDGQRVWITGIRPIVDNDNATVAVGKRDGRGAAITYRQPVSMNRSGYCPQRTSSRFIRARLQIPAGETWTHAQGVEPVVQADGER